MGDEEKIDSEKKYTYKLKNIWIVIRDVIIFAILALFFGFLLEMIIPNLKPNESHLMSFFYIILQLILAAIIVYMLAILYEKITGSDIYDYLGIIIFLTIPVRISQSVIHRNVASAFIPKSTC